MAEEYRRIADDGAAAAAAPPTMDARAAFREKDAEASKNFHVARSLEHAEQTSEEGKFLKPMIFGGLDGISTIFAFLSGAVGANLSIVSTIAIGCAQLFAGALGMGLGEYLSSQAEQEVARREEAREMWEVENFPEGEIAEMVKIYVDKGLTEDDAQKVAQILSKYKDFWVEHMMLHEIGMIPPDDASWSAVIQGVVMFFSFLILGGLPLLAYVLVAFVTGAEEQGFRVTCAASSASLFLLGVVKARMADLHVVRGGAAMTVQGVLCAGSAYLIGTLVPEYIVE